MHASGFALSQGLILVAERFCKANTPAHYCSTTLIFPKCTMYHRQKLKLQVSTIQAWEKSPYPHTIPIAALQAPPHRLANKLPCLQWPSSVVWQSPHPKACACLRSQTPSSPAIPPHCLQLVQEELMLLQGIGDTYCPSNSLGFRALAVLTE